MFRVIVCLKLVLDPDIPLSAFRIDIEAKRPIPPEGMPLVISPFDENALEAALRVKDELGCQVTVLTLGNLLPRGPLQKCFALGVDEVITLEGLEFDSLDPFSTAYALAGAIKKIGDFQLVFTGRQAADWDAGLVWAGIAEALGLPSISIAQKAVVSGDNVIVERVTNDGIETLKAKLPAVISFSNEAGELRPMSLRDLVMAKKRQITRWSAKDIDFRYVSPLTMEYLRPSEVGIVECQFIHGPNSREKGRALARELFRTGYIDPTEQRKL